MDPEDLWKWMGAYEQKAGEKLLAIPHNGNLSNGLMFDDGTLTTKKPFDRDYAQRGVPMGADLKAAPAGKTQEKVYDVAWSGGRKPGNEGSCRRWATRCT